MQPRTCVKCTQIPEDILLLKCNHHLCVNCAALRLSFSQKNVICQYCNQQTILDSQSIFQLQKLRVILEDRKHKSNNKQLNKRQQNRSLQNGKQDSPSHPSTKKICRQHFEQQVLYYCFDCECQCICPECIIHGDHHDHNVETLKKSHPIMKAKLQNELGNLSKNIQLICKKKNDIDNHMKKLKVQCVNYKKQIQKAFMDLKITIDKKQQQILESCDQLMEEQIISYENQKNELDKKLQDIVNFSSQILYTTKRDQIALLNFYGKNKNYLKDMTKKFNSDNFFKPNTSKQIPITTVVQFLQKYTSQIFHFDFEEAVIYYQPNETKQKNKKQSPKKVNDNSNTKDNRKKD